MIIDTLINARKYEAMHPLFNVAFDYLKTAPWSDQPIQVCDGIEARFIQEGPKTTPFTFEVHRQNIDIQLILEGIDRIGYSPIEKTTGTERPYDDLKDTEKLHGQPTSWLTLNRGEFAIFYPTDAHAPQRGEGIVKKIVLKVRI